MQGQPIHNQAVCAPPAAASTSSQSSYSSFVDPPSILDLGQPPGSFLLVVEYHDDGPHEVARQEGMHEQVGAAFQRGPIGGGGC